MDHWVPKLTGSGTPRYAQIAEAIRADIERGVLKPGERLPSQRQIAQVVSIDTSTVSRGYVEAARRGYIDSHVGRGSFVPEACSSADPLLNCDADLRPAWR